LSSVLQNIFNKTAQKKSGASFSDTLLFLLASWLFPLS